MSQAPPSLVILAGPNGAGKSTVAPALLRGVLAVTEFVDADVIARGLSAFNPGQRVHWCRPRDARKAARARGTP